MASPGAIPALRAILLAIALILATSPQQAMADWPVALAASNGTLAETQPEIQPLAIAIEDLDDSGPVFHRVDPPVAATILTAYALVTICPTGVLSLDQRSCARPFGRGPPSFLFS